MQVGTAAAQAADPGTKSWRPQGVLERAFYDRRRVVGVCGPAGTGKSRMWLEKLHLVCEKYPGARCMIARKTRESLSEAALATFEQEVLPEGHYLLTGARRSHRTSYNYANGSTIVVIGLDKPGKAMSAQYDIIYVQEFTECDRNDLETLVTRIRNFQLPYQQIVLDYNPAWPTHWVNQAGLSGEFAVYNSYHEDNPTYWVQAPEEAQRRARLLPQGYRATEEWPAESPDGRVGRWTERGRLYVFETLSLLTGARLLRLRYGKWAAAEGAVYDKWDHDHNDVELFVPPASWRRFWVADFGFTAPMCIQAWAVDGDGRMWMYREVYHTRRLVRENAGEMLEACGWSYDKDSGYTALVPAPDVLPETVVCDWDAAGRAELEDATGLPTTEAYKGIENGLQAVMLRVPRQPDGMARIFICKGSVITTDDSLKKAAKPQSTLEEVDGYVWKEDKNKPDKKGEIPVQVNDHGMDTERYAVCYVDNVRDEWKADDVPMAAAVSGSGVLGVAAVPQRREEVRVGGVQGKNDGGRGARNHSAAGRAKRRVKWPPDSWRR